MNAQGQSAINDKDNARALSIEALTAAKELIRTARPRFPKSMHHADKFRLELTNATINKALAALGAE